MGRNGVIWVWIGVLIGAVQGGEPAADGPVSKKNAAVSEAAGEQDVLARLAELEAQIAKLTQDAVDDRESTGFLSLLEERFDMGGEIEVEFVDSQRENNPGGPLPSGGESSPYVRLDKLRLSPRVTFTGRRAPLQITAEGDIDFLVRTTSRARVKEFYLAIEGVHSEWAESRLRIGLDDAFMKPPNMIDTEAWPLAVTAFSRNETLGFFWRTRLGDRREALGRFSLQASLTNGFRLRDRDPGEDDAFEMIGQEGRVGGRGSALREYGFGVGWERRWFEGSGLIDRIDTDISCFYTNDSLQSDDDLVYLRDPNYFSGSRIATSNLRGREIWGGSASLEVGGLKVTGHALKGRDGRLRRKAGFVEAGYRHRFDRPILLDYLVRGITPLVRYGWLDLNCPRKPSQPVTWDRRRWTFGVITEVRRTMNLKVEYTYNIERTGARNPRTNEFLVQLELVF